MNWQRKQILPARKALGLETIEEQMSAIDKIPLTVQAKMLVESMQSKGNDEYNDLLKAYLAQDLDALNGLMGDQMDPQGTWIHY